MTIRLDVPNPTIGAIPYLCDMILSEFPDAKLNFGPRPTPEETIEIMRGCNAMIAAGDLVAGRSVLPAPTAKGETGTLIAGLRSRLGLAYISYHARPSRGA